MRVHRCDQGSEEWLALRAGRPTASEFDSLITPLGKIKTGDAVDTYLGKKLAERWLGRPLQWWRGGEMDQGNILEDEAIPYVEMKLDIDIDRVGFVTTDDDKVGASPDGLIRETGIEIKCPQPHTHVGYLLDNVLPTEYIAQVQGGMCVTGAASWRFVSYCRLFPPLILTIARDEKFIGSLVLALNAFCLRLDDGYARLVELNNGEPKRWKEGDKIFTPKEVAA